MKTKIALLLLLVVSITGAIADGEIAISDNVSDNTTLPTDLDAGIIEEEKNNPPGFEAVFAIAGLLGVAYLVLRQKED